jgi:hypothetical protein
MTSAQDTTSVAAYYRDEAVRARLAEYCGAGADGRVSSVFVTGFDPARQPYPVWNDPPHVPVSALADLEAQGCDVARSLWDRHALIFVLDLDYQNLDHPAEPFTHPTDVFFKLEYTYASAWRVLHRAGLEPLVIATGRGYHFVGQVAIDDPAADRLAALADRPAWYSGYAARRAAGISATMTERYARAAAGLGLVTEHMAHAVLREARRASLVPVVLNGTTVGSGIVGRECASIDFSHAGDPLDQRHLRMAYSTYQWHRARPDIFGPAVSAHPPLVARIRRQRALEEFLLAGRDLESSKRAAASDTAVIPDVTRAVERLAVQYRKSALRKFHKTFAAERRLEAQIPDLPEDLPPCIVRPLRQPNDLLLKPEYLQNLVRGLLARDWRASDIAALVEREYLADHGWGGRWARLDARTRADFDVRVFAGLVVTGLDSLVDFNCASSQDKELCPRTGCQHDLRKDRDALLARYAS